MVYTECIAGNAVQKQCSDMMMLDFLTLDEYVELNNEIDRYIQYTLSNGGMK